jgi:hypothetical protein
MVVYKFFVHGFKEVFIFKKIIFILLVSTILFPKILFSQNKLGLLIIAHGSPSSKWNAPVLLLEKEVKEIFTKNKDNHFAQIRVAFMEFSKPSISEVIRDMEKEGIEKVYAIPLLIAPSGHLVYDIPTILGLYSEKHIIEEIKKEGTEIVNSKIKIVLGPTLNNSNILREIMLDRVKEFSTMPDSEGVVLLAHGDDDFRGIWDSLCREIGDYIISKTGIKYFDYSFIEVGQSFMQKGVPTILKVSDKSKKTIVVGLYLSKSAEDIFLKSIKEENKKIFKDKHIYFSKHPILPDRRVSQWIVDRAMEWLNTLEFKD